MTIQNVYQSVSHYRFQVW